MRTAGLLLIGAIVLSGCSREPLASSSSNDKANEDKASSQTSAPEDTIAHYQLNGDAVDSSANGQDGNSQGAMAATGVDGVAASAMAFHGSRQHIDLPDELVATPALTISAWVNTASNGAAIISNNNGGLGRFDFSIEYKKFIVFVGGQSENFLIDSGEVVSDRQWHLLTATLDNDVWTLYVDSVKKITAKSDYKIDSTKDLRLGASPINRRNLVGSVDDLRFYDRALNQDEIAAIYKTFKP